MQQLSQSLAELRAEIAALKAASSQPVLSDELAKVDLAGKLDQLFVRMDQRRDEEIASQQKASKCKKLYQAMLQGDDEEVEHVIIQHLHTLRRPQARFQMHARASSALGQVWVQLHGCHMPQIPRFVCKVLLTRPLARFCRSIVLFLSGLAAHAGPDHRLDVDQRERHDVLTPGCQILEDALDGAFDCSVS